MTVSARMEHQPPPFFNRGPAPLVRLAFFVSIAVLLMVLDARFRYAERAPGGGARRLSDSARRHGAGRSVSCRRQLLRQHRGAAGGERRAQDESASRAPELLQLEALKEENNQLRRLLEAQERLPGKSVFAEILYAGRDPFSRKVVIDKGRATAYRRDSR